MPSPDQPPTSEAVTYMRAVMANIGADKPIMVGPQGGEPMPLPPEAAELVRQVIATLASGRSAMVTEPVHEMTPNQAADFLNVSRMFVMRLIADGTLPTRMVGSHHRLPYADLVAYKDAQKARSRAALDELHTLSRDMGLYDLPPLPDDREGK